MKRRKAAVLVAASAVLAGASPPLLLLKSGSKFDLPFGPNSEQSATIRLQRGESAEIIVLQKGIDVVVALRSPDGTLLDEVDSPNARNGDEPVHIYASVPGEYHIHVRPFAKTEPQAAIEVRVAALRNAAETARLRRAQAQVRSTAAEWLRVRASALPPLDRVADVPALGPFDRLAASARVMGLGEATHGSREFGDVRLALVKRLVERHGYRLVAVEDSISRWRLMEPYVAGLAPAPAAAPEWGWIGRRSRRELLEWARSWNLEHPTDRIRIVGVDPQDNRPEREALGPLLERAFGEAVKEPWTKAAAAMAAADEQAQVFGDSSIDPAVRAFLHETVARLEGDAPLLKRRMGEPDYRRALDYSREMAATADFNGGGPLGRSRDWYMAQWTLRALDAAGLDAKAAYWAHNSHVSATARSWEPTGALLRSALGCGYRALATTFGQGQFLVQASGDPSNRLYVETVAAPDEETVEAALAQVRPGAHIASWDCGPGADRGPSWLKTPRRMRWIGGVYAPGSARSASYRPYAVTEAFDGIVYFPFVRAEADPGDRPAVAPRTR